MNDIRRVLRAASRRLLLQDWLSTFVVTLAVGLGAVLVTRIVERTFGLVRVFEPVWPKVFIWVPVGVVVVSLIWALLRRRNELKVARELDERAGLRESLGTALCVEKSPDPWAKAVIETAVTKARGVNVRSALPYEAPSAWPWPIGIATALMILWMTLPVFDVMGLFKKQQAKEEKEQQVVQVKAELQEKSQKLQDALKKIQNGSNLLDDKGEEGKESQETAKDLDPEAMRRSAVKQLTDLSERLEKMKEGDKAAQVEAMKEAMKQLKTEKGPMEEFSKALSRGDFGKAEQQLEQLQKQMADGSMNDEQKEQAKKQLENMAQQLEKLSKDQQEVVKKLQEAGLDKKTAEEAAKKASSGDPEALKKALEQMKNLSPEQMQKMLQMAKSASEACKNAGSMSEAMSKMAQGMSQEGMDNQGTQGMEKLAAELSDMEMMQNDMENMDAALSEAKAQLAELGKCLGGNCNGDGDQMGNPSMGSFKQGDATKRGNGSGGPGISNGSPGRPEEAADFAYEKKKSNVSTTQGAIIGSRLVQGEQVKGESRADFAAVVEASSKTASESIEGMTVPREYQDAVKHYFGRLKEKAKVNKGEGEAKPAPASETKK